MPRLRDSLTFVTILMLAVFASSHRDNASASLVPPTLLTPDFAGGVESANGRFLLFGSDRSDLIQGDTNGRDDVFLRDAATGNVERISVGAAGEQANGSSQAGGVSDDGRFAVFSSAASNLFPGDTNGWDDVFVKDRATGALELISRNTTGGVGNWGSTNARISPDGRYVLFDSGASDLIESDTSPCNDRDHCTETFVYDRSLATLDRVSLSSTGAQANMSTLLVDMTPDARFVLFASEAFNLDPLDISFFPYDLFVRDRATNQTEVVTLGDYGGVQGFDGNAGISADGRFVVFDSRRELLQSESEDYTDAIADVYIRDLQTNTTSRLLTPDGSPINADSLAPSISRDGRYIAMSTRATNLIPGLTGEFSQVVVFDRLTGTYELASRTAAGQPGDGGSGPARFTDNSGVIRFITGAPNLLPNGPGPQGEQLRYERCAASGPDGDCVPVWYEAVHACLSEATDDTGDSDSDGVNTLDEFYGDDLIRASGDDTDPCDLDTDDDGFADLRPSGHIGPANPSPGRDNCPLVPNADQANHDGDFTDLTPPLAYNDQTSPISDGFGDACDGDDDNDGWLDVYEASSICFASSGLSDPTLADTDGDLFIDLRECQLNKDVLDADSRPDVGYCSDPYDPDADGLTSGKEECYYGTNPVDFDTDGDGCSDGRELASVNGDRKVNAIDLSQIAQHFDPGYALPAPAWKVTFDFNRDGKISSIDLSQVAQRFGEC